MKFVITGASSGLGALIAENLVNEGHQVFNWSKEVGVDIRDSQSIYHAQKALKEQRIDGLINCAGVVHLEWFESMLGQNWDEVMDVNVGGIFRVSQAMLLNLLGGFICNITSTAAFVPMTNSAAYNASKAAAHMLTLQMGRELKKTHNITVFGVAPNKLKGTPMSLKVEERVRELRGWTKEFADAYQLKALPAGEETDPRACAEFISFLALRPHIHKYLNSTVLPFGGCN